MTHKMIVRLMQVLGSLDTGFEEFEKHLISPECIATDRARELFAYFERHFGRYNTTNLNPKKIFKAIYPEESSYKRRKVNELVRELTELLDDFLPPFVARVDPKLKKAIRRRLYHENHEEVLFYEQLEMPDKVPLKSLGSRTAQEQMNSCDDFYAFQPEEKSEQELTISLVNTRKLNRVSYEITELKACCTLINREAQYGHVLELDFKQKLRDFIDGLVYREVLLINALALSADFYLKPDVQKYEVFKAFFLDSLGELPERFELLHMLINGLSYINPMRGTRREYYFLYKIGVDYDILTKNKYIPAYFYLDVVHVSFSMGELNWAGKFKEQYKELLSEKSTKVVEITEAYFDFGNGNYQKVIDRLKNRHFRNDAALSLKKYPLLLKSMYLLKGEEAYFDLPDTIRGFKGLLKRQKKSSEINETVYGRFFNFATFVNELKKAELTKEELIEQLENLGYNVVEVPWLKKALDDLATRD